MGQFTDVVLGFPTVLFTGGLVAVVAFWAIVLVGGADAHGPWHHGATGGHGGTGGDSGHGALGGRHDQLSADTAGSHAGGAGALAAAGLGGVPVTVVLSLLVALSWFLTLAGSAALHGANAPGGPVRALLYAVVTAAALVGAWFATWLLVRPLRRLFPDVRPPSREDFVGQVCVIRTGTVTAGFGQAEVTAPDGSTAVVQVRQTGEDAFRSGSTALLYAYDPDGEFFWVAPFDTVTAFDTFTT
ncbi:hypothetical protein [Streptomyces sp. NBC_01477]|uniref:hypothetical protein n=1 Tax=Streptomyces sp. NBC_01477 TaxID=2976015 RepID=UPI002E35D19B|nr:hypothetical protein [Streptomyces sp. NBC_01477]